MNSIVLVLLVLLIKANTGESVVFPINVTLLSPTSALVSWSAPQNTEDSSISPLANISVSSLRYEVTYRPVKERVRTVAAVARGLTSFLLTDLRPGTIYSITVTSISRRQRRRSSPAVLLVPPLIESSPRGMSSTSSSPPYLQVRAEEVGIVIVVLAVWAAAITLFFHRWGKIRMLLPYQPDFKEDLHINTGPAIPPLPQQTQIACRNTPSFGICTAHAEMSNITRVWPASMSRLDSLEAARNRYSRTLTTSSGQSASFPPLCRLPRRKTKSAEVITFTVTQCTDSSNSNFSRNEMTTTECAF